MNLQHFTVVGYVIKTVNVGRPITNITHDGGGVLGYCRESSSWMTILLTTLGGVYKWNRCSACAREVSDFPLVGKVKLKRYVASTTFRWSAWWWIYMLRVRV